MKFTGQCAVLGLALTAAAAPIGNEKRAALSLGSGLSIPSFSLPAGGALPTGLLGSSSGNGGKGGLSLPSFSLPAGGALPTGLLGSSGGSGGIFPSGGAVPSGLSGGASGSLPSIAPGSGGQNGGSGTQPTGLPSASPGSALPGSSYGQEGIDTPTATKENLALPSLGGTSTSGSAGLSSKHFRFSRHLLRI